MRKYNLKLKKHEIFSTEIGKEIFRMWFNRWTTSYSICKAYHQSNVTHGGDAYNYCQALKELGFLQKNNKVYPQISLIKKWREKGVKCKKIDWKRSSKKYTAYRINLEAFFLYTAKEMGLQFNKFDRYIINLIFSSNLARKKVLSPKKPVFQALKDIILDYLRLPLGDIKEDLLDYWTTEMTRIEGFILFLKVNRESITFEEFKGLKDKVSKGQNLIPGCLTGKSMNNQIYQLMCFVPNNFLRKIAKISMANPFYKLWEKEYNQNLEVKKKPAKNLYSNMLFLEPPEQNAK